MHLSDSNGIVFLRIIYKWKKQILIFVLISLTGSIIFSGPYFIPPLYKTEVVFYPPGTNSYRVLIEKDPRFGSDKEIDEQMQILKSAILRDSIISNYKLVEHYDVDTINADWTYALYRKYENNISVERTEFNSIKVSVFDTDPVKAAMMANDIVKMGDAVKSAIIKENLLLAFNSISKAYFDKSVEVDRIIENLNKFIDSPLSRQVTVKDKTNTELLKEQLDIQAAIEKARIAGKLGNLQSLFDYQFKLQQLNEIQKSYFLAYVSLNNVIPSCYIISPAEPSYKKAAPKRSLIVVVTFITSFLFAAMLVVGIEKISKIKQRITLHP